MQAAPNLAALGQAIQIVERKATITAAPAVSVSLTLGHVPPVGTHIICVYGPRTPYASISGKPAGLVEVGHQDRGSTMTLLIGIIPADGVAGTFQFTTSTSVSQTLELLVVAGLDPITPIDRFAGADGGAAALNPGQLTAGPTAAAQRANELAVAAWLTSAPAVAWGTPDGGFGLAGVPASGGSGTRLAVARRRVANPAIHTVTETWSATNTLAVAALATFRAAA